MEISISEFVIMSLIYFVAAHIGLYKIFEKIGLEGWKALVPFYGTYLAVKIVNKSWLWTITYYVPFLGFVVWMGIVVELLKLLGKTSFKEHFLGIVFAGLYLPYIGFKEDVKFIGYEEAAKYKKSFKREWADAIIFAVVAATLIRGFYIEAFTIPTSSMEQKLLVGDFLFVNKMAYGARVPNTPISFPFTHHSFPDWIPFVGGNQSYIELVKFPHAKLPKMGNVERNDCVVFNFPAGDTVTVETMGKTIYEQMIRDESLRQGISLEKAWKFINENYTIKSRPVDKKENYIKRCVGLPGDKLEIIDNVLMINNKQAYFDENAQFNYYVTTNGTGLPESTLQKKKITTESISVVSGMPNTYRMTLTNSTAEKVKQFSQVVSVEKVNYPLGYNYATDLNYFQLNPIFPNSSQYNWSRDNFGPMVIPKKGATVKLSLRSLPLYRRIIKNYEGNDLSISGDKIIINGEVATSYTFKMDYFWMMGDNRHNSQDSRYWGFVPENHVVGKAVFVWMSWDSQQGGIRWNRLFSLVD